ncbi:hypothetical protein BCR34DRAFT_584065 [Clohesyomyces aquaticus]|uniref:PARP catalytic domain-containing protein n=1 Tax=Clohesyomyces aquaticus TaxID=1231657 RepID=A0A1Y2A3C4_9PLEO|nr:hypothetical protein BCR34DRAFT_584065 [Clohesyomyces aquaticus]
MKWPFRPKPSTSPLPSPPPSASVSNPVPIRPIPPPPERPPDSVQRARWHNEIATCRTLYEYLDTGRDDGLTPGLERARTITHDYLYQRDSVILRSPESDALLEVLIKEHRHADVAIASCLQVLSIPAAHRQLLSLLKGDRKRYIRLLVLAGRINASFLTTDEAELVRALHQLIIGDHPPLQYIQCFRTIIEYTGSQELVGLAPRPLIAGILIDIDCRTRLQALTNSLMERFCYLSAFKAFAWLKSTSGYSNRQFACELLDMALPSWQELRCWEPKIARISQFQNTSFSDEQKQRLLHLMNLEGPDTLTREKSSLARVDLGHRQNPSCPFSSTEAEELLDILCSCAKLGTHAIDLFLGLCLDTTHADYEFGPPFLKNAVDSGDDLLCLHICVLLEGAKAETHVSHKLIKYTKALPFLDQLNSLWLDRPPLVHAVTQIESIMSVAQEEFGALLKTTSGRRIGLLMQAYAEAILHTRSVHAYLSADFLSHIRQLPDRDTLNAVFERIRKQSSNLPVQECRFKSFVASILGGRVLTLDRTITTSAIQNEIRFWKHPPDTARKDLARVMEKIKTVQYSLYTSWLVVILRESDQFVGEVRHIMMSEMEVAVLRLANYLAIRRRFNQLRDETWLLLFASLIQDQGPDYLQRMADSMPVAAWLDLLRNLSTLVGSVRGRLPDFGAGLKQEQLQWWETLSRKEEAIHRLLGQQNHTQNPTWLYFPTFPREIEILLDKIGSQRFEKSEYCHIVTFLSRDGKNILDLCECVDALEAISQFGHKIFMRQLSRHQGKGVVQVTGIELQVLMKSWLREGSPLSRSEKRALETLAKLLRLPSSSAHLDMTALMKKLASQYEGIMGLAGFMEKLRFKLLHANADRVSTVLERLHVDNTNPGRVAQGIIPDEISHAVEIISDDEYEVSFPLTNLNNVQRASKGIPPNSRLLLLRLSLRQPAFCIHFAPDQEGGRRHKPWQCINARQPERAICTTPPTLFTYYLGRKLNHLLSGVARTLSEVYETVISLINSSPDTCLVCTEGLGQKLWKPTTCSHSCSAMLRNSPLEVRLHNLLIDPKAIDLLLTSIHAAASEAQATILLPNCPIPVAALIGVIDSMPPLADLQTAADLRAAIQGSDGQGKNREALLSWLCMKFRGFILSAASIDCKVPSLGTGTEQFIMLNSNHETERAFGTHLLSGSTAVFHGTRPSRLFPILVDGLRVADHTLQLNGAAYGAGIYCGDDPRTSWGFSGTTGQSWSRSTMKNMHVMLGCELAPATPGNHGTVHVITDATRLLVRYVFLLPPSFQPPIRVHVEPAMTTAFAKLRSGLST